MNDTSAGPYIGAAEELAKGPFAERAGVCDRERRFPAENFVDLHRAGLLALTVPERFGGVAATWSTYVSVLRTLASGCASTANAFNMHANVLRFVAALAPRPLQVEVFGAVVEEGALVGSLTSEPGTTLRMGLRLGTELRESGDRLIVSGKKHFCTIATHARWYHVMGRDPEREGAHAIRTALVPRESPGIEVHDDWQTLGMRATASNSVSFHDVEVDRALEVDRGGQMLERGDHHAFVPGYAAISLGIAEAAYAYATHYARTARFEGSRDALAAQAPVQRAVAEMSTFLAAARALLTSAAAAADRSTVAESAQLVQQAKLFVCDGARDVVGLALDVCGGRGFSESAPLERHLRDAQAGNLMQPAVDVCREQVGRRELGLDPYLGRPL